jgi:cyclohexanecarboxylate-CoA ligase
MPVDLGITIDPAYAADMRAKGFWKDQMLIDLLAQHVAAQPEKVAVVDRKSTRGGTRQAYTYRDLDRDSTRIGLGLAAEGIDKGDVVAMQIPNWYEAMAIMLGCWKIGAIINPVMPIFRRREVRFMLEFAETKVLIVPAEFRGFDHAALARELAADLPNLEHVHVIGGDFEGHFLDRAWEEEIDSATLFAERRPTATDFCQLIYTSGTTGEPKGALHCQNTLMPGLNGFIDKGLSAGDVIFMPSPIAHQTGFLVGLMLPIVLGGSVALQDIWNGATGGGDHRGGELLIHHGLHPFPGRPDPCAELGRPRYLQLHRLSVRGGSNPACTMRDRSGEVGLPHHVGLGHDGGGFGHQYLSRRSAGEGVWHRWSPLR